MKNVYLAFIPLYSVFWRCSLGVTFDERSFSTANEISPLSSALVADDLSTRPALFPVELEPLQHIDNSDSLS